MDDFADFWIGWNIAVLECSGFLWSGAQGHRSGEALSDAMDSLSAAVEIRPLMLTADSEPLWIRCRWMIG
jgi:hypothetical protein